MTVADTAGPNEPQPATDDRPLPRCAEIMAAGPWQKLPGHELRWVWRGESNKLPESFVAADVPTRRFPSARPDRAICLIRCQDGGLISYERDHGQWLHTLNTTSTFRYRVFELNLVPITELGSLLGRE